MAAKKPADTTSEDRATSVSRLLGNEAVQKFLRTRKIETVKANEIPPIERISTGVFPLDYALAGGFPLGRTTVCFGGESSGKTTTFLKAIGQAQQICRFCHRREPDCMKSSCAKFEPMRVAFLDQEDTFDPVWAELHGVNTAELTLTPPMSGEDVVDYTDVLLRSGECDLICLDSVAFTIPTKVIDSEAEALNPGAHARLMSKFVQKVLAASSSSSQASGHRPTMFLTNQIRMTFTMFGNPEVQTGGKTLPFLASVMVRFSQGKVQIDKETGTPLFASFGYRVVKNKTSVPKMEGDYEMLLGDTDHKRKGSIHDEPFVLEQAERYGILEKSGSGWTCFGERHASRSVLELKMMTDPSFNQKLRESVMTVLLKSL